MAGGSHFERRAKVRAVGNDLSLRGVLEQLVLETAIPANWRERDALEHSVDVYGADGIPKGP